MTNAPIAFPQHLLGLFNPLIRGVVVLGNDQRMPIFDGNRQGVLGASAILTADV
ncbi:MAG TPA: hypothetical protein VIM69_11080 [Opitutaceae bacterium]